MGNLCIKSNKGATDSKSASGSPGYSEGSKCYTFTCTDTTPNAGAAGCWVNLKSNNRVLIRVLKHKDVVFLNATNNTLLDKEIILNDFLSSKVGFKFFKTKSAFEIEYASLQKLNENFTSSQDKTTLDTCTALYQNQGVNGFIIQSNSDKFTLTATVPRSPGKSTSKKEVKTRSAYVIMYTNCSYNLTQVPKNSLDVKKFMKDITPFMKKLHESDLEHLDLKLENIVYCKHDDKFRIIDFALTTNETQKSFQMSPPYMLPNILNYTRPNDWMGILANIPSPHASLDKKSLFRVQQSVFGNMEMYIKRHFPDVVRNPTAAVEDRLINDDKCMEQIFLWPQKTAFSRWIFRKTDDYALAMILYNIFGSEITVDGHKYNTYFKELLKVEPYFDSRPLRKTSIGPSDVRVAVGGLRKPRKASLLKKRVNK